MHEWIEASKENMKQTYLHSILLLGLLCALPVFAQELVMPETEAIAIEESLASDSVPADTLFILPYPQILLDMPNVSVEQDSLITLLMKEKIAGIERGEQEMEGYRVQIYSSNHPKHGKQNALLIEQRVKALVDEPVYVIYATPSWKVRLGNFRTKEDAQVFRDAFKELCPDLADYTYIVRDKIKIR